LHTWLYQKVTGLALLPYIIGLKKLAHVFINQ